MDPVTIMAVLGALGAAKHYVNDVPEAAKEKKYESAKERFSPWTHQHGQYVKDPSLFGTLLQAGGTGLALSKFGAGGNGADGADGADGGDGSTVGKDLDGNRVAKEGDSDFRGPPSSAMSDGAELTDDKPVNVPTPGSSASPYAKAPGAVAPASSNAEAFDSASQGKAPVNVYSKGAVGGGNVPFNPNYRPDEYMPQGGFMGDPNYMSPYRKYLYSDGAVGGGRVPLNPDFVTRR